MQQFVIRTVEKHDIALLDTALRALSEDLGDKHPTGIDLLEQAGFGPTPAFYALIALHKNGTVCGAVMFSPVMSTTLAATGLYVSDLWVAKATRGCGLGRRLLAQAADVAYVRWGANYLKLAVYDGSTDTRRFYNRLGLTVRRGETMMFLEKFKLNKLRCDT